MSASTGRRLPLRVVRQPSFLFFAIARVGSAMSATMFTAVVFWQVHEISDSAFLLAAVGLARFVPNFFLILLGGAVADRYNARLVMIVAQFVQVAAVGLLALWAAGDADSLPMIYAMVALVAAGSAFDWPARGTLLPRTVDKASFADAIVVNGTFQQFAFVSGPVAGGFLIAAGGPAVAYLGTAVLQIASIAAVAFIRLRDVERTKREVSIGAVFEGVRFVFSRQAILGAMTLDMFAVIFGGAIALFPVYAQDILDVGSVGYGLLFAAMDAGALLMSLALLLLPPVERTGRALIIAVAGFGAATVMFGLSRWFPLSLASLFLVGLFDEISVVMRQTTIQLSTPDELRGRVTAVNMLFIGTSNQLGPVESGVVAGLTNPTFAVVSGGLGCIAALTAVALRMPALRQYRLVREIPTEEPAAAAAG